MAVQFIRRTGPIVCALILLTTGRSAGQTFEDIPPPGRLVDIGGYRLHLHCRGAGSPTVVIDVGAGSWSMHYSHIQSALSANSRVCTYDRAGLGWSDPGPEPRTSGRMAEELHRLLHAAGITPPLLLVGHSLGGYNVRVYQHRYPEEVAGLVLVEAGHEGQWDRLPPEWAAGVKALVPALRAQAEAARLGTLDASAIRPSAFTAHAPEWREEDLVAKRGPKVYLGTAAENEGAFQSAREVPSGRLGALPLVVLTARRSFDAFAGSGLDIKPANRVWLELQHELAHLSTNVVHLFSDGDHRLNASDPEAVVNAIRRGVRMLAGPPPPSALGLAAALPPDSTGAVDRLLRQLEEAYASMDATRFVELFTEDVVQLDVPRRVHIKGRERWLAQTRTINEAHRRLARQHRGRAIAGDWVVAEVEWSGRVTDEALGAPGEDRDYRYTGLVLMRLRDGRIAEQIIYGDVPRLDWQLRIH